MKKLFKYLLIIILLVIAFQLVSCSPQKRAKRHIRKALILDPTILQKDTLIINDTILLNEIQKDTVVSLERLTDTFYLEKDKLSVKLIKIHDSVYIDAKCKSDTVFYNKEIPVEKIIYKNYPKPIQKIIDNLWIYLCLFLLLIIAYFKLSK